MSRSNPNLNGCEEKSTDRPRVRDAHFVLGVDNDGTTHHRDLVSETVHWIDQDSQRIGRKIVPDGRVDDYVEAVANASGWADLRYGKSLVDQLIELYEEQERARREEVTA